MNQPKNEGNREWVGVLALAITALTTLAAPLLYLNSTLHQIDNRLTRIEVVLGIDEPGVKLSTR